MKIVLAQSAGFCFGVKRATNIAFEAARTHSCICSLGPIIHSPQVVRKLQELGVTVQPDVEQIQEGAVIIRSHGVTADVSERLLEKRLKVVDATCPFVKKAQEYAGLLSQQGYVVVLVGEEDHPEVQGIVSYARHSEVFVVGNREQAQGLPSRVKMGLVAQTTQSLKNFREVAEVCLEKSKELRIFNTICDATTVRQDEARKIAEQTDLVLVIGGYNSANTNRLAQISHEIQPSTYHVETAADIDPKWFDGVELVGITAGASTPHWIIEEVMEKVQGIKK